MNLKPLFEPRTLAVIGVSSTNERHPANVIFEKNNHRYPVEVFGVNPRGGKLHDEPLFERKSTWPSSRRARISCRTFWRSASTRA